MAKGAAGRDRESCRPPSLDCGRAADHRDSSRFPALARNLATGVTQGEATEARRAAGDGRTHPHLRGFTDQVEALLDDTSPPGILLKISPPSGDRARILTLRLMLHPGSESPSEGEPPDP
jgi:hypothetical protein